MSDGEKGKPAQAVESASAEKQKSETLAEVLLEKAPDVLKSIPPEKQAILARVRIEKHELSMRHSPLPDPAELAEYDKIIPAGADRILKMAEAQSAHRIEIESRVVRSQQTQGFCGQLFALIITLAALGMATYAALSGQPWFGSIIGGTTLVSVVGAFLYSRHLEKGDLNDKRQQMPESPRFPNIGPNSNRKNRKQKNRNR
jgi:uncharacterized membrane protein